MCSATGEDSKIREIEESRNRGLEELGGYSTKTGQIFESSNPRILESSHFSLFSLSPSFVIDLAQLEQTYFALQRQYHPDRFSARPLPERQVALQQSMAINEAYDVLRNPLKRARYLLEIQGIYVGGDRDNVKPAPTLLMEVMEMRERLEALSDKQAVVSFAAMLEAQHVRILAEIQRAYANLDWQRMAQETLRLNYVMKIREDIHA